MQVSYAQRDLSTSMSEKNISDVDEFATDLTFNFVRWFLQKCLDVCGNNLCCCTVVCVEFLCRGATVFGMEGLLGQQASRHVLSEQVFSRSGASTRTVPGPSFYLMRMLISWTILIRGFVMM